MGALIGLAVASGQLLFREWPSGPDPERQAAQIEQTVLAGNSGLAIVAQREASLWAEAHRALVQLLRDHKRDLSNADIMAWEAPLDRRIKQAAAAAGDPAVVAIYAAKRTLLQTLQAASPEACQSYVNLDVKALAALPGSLKKDVRTADDALYAAYQEGVGRPAPVIPTEAQADAVLARLQRSTGIVIDQRELDLIDGTATGSAAETCAAMLRFMALLTTAPPADAAPAIRYMLVQ